MSDTSIKIPGKLLIGLANWISSQNLSAKDSRHRTRFVELLLPEIKRFEKETTTVLEKHARKNEAGNPISKVTEDGTSYGS